MSACLLLDPLQLHLEMSVVFVLSIYTAMADTWTVGNGNVLLGFFGGVGRNFNKKIGLGIIAEKMKVCFISM